MKNRWKLVVCAGALATMAGGYSTVEQQTSAASVPVPRFKVDPYWPKPLPQVKGSDGQLRRWLTGDVGAVCVPLTS